MTISKYLERVLKAPPIAMLLLSCAGASSNSEAPASTEPPSEEEVVVPPPPQCLGEDGKQAECSDDRDCCPNYYCGKDPEGSHLKRVCLYSGSK